MIGNGEVIIARGREELPSQVEGELEEAEGEVGGLTGNYCINNMYNFKYYTG